MISCNGSQSFRKHSDKGTGMHANAPIQIRSNDFRKEPEATTAKPWYRRTVNGVTSAVQWLFGGISVVVGLSILSIFPVLNLLSLGYLMKASGRVQRTGRIRDGMIGFKQASLAGGLTAGIWISCWPIRFAMDLARDAALIVPNGKMPIGWETGISMGILFTVGHILWAIARGGKLRHFIWPAPVRFLKWWIRGSDDSLKGLQWEIRWSDLGIGDCFTTGLGGFLGAIAWLSLPVLIIWSAGRLPKEPGILVSLLGGLLLAWVSVYLPFLQTQFAAEPNWKNLFSVRKVRNHFKKAPIAFVLGLWVTLLFSIPLYLLKVELAPRELAWLPGLLFVVFIFPARLTCGWAMHRATRQEGNSFFVWRWIGRLGVLVVGSAYGMLVFFTQFLSWNGIWSLLEQHAFMVPAPWLSL